MLDVCLELGVVTIDLCLSHLKATCTTEHHIDNANISQCSNNPLPNCATSTKANGKIYKSITNVGDCPTVNDNKIKFETHIIDFNENLYGKEIEVMFHAKMRDTVSFENIEALKNQLTADVLKRREMN